MSVVGTCPAELVEAAVAAVEASGPVIRAHYRTGFAVDTKTDQSPVTIADREAERAIRETLARLRPGDGVIGEEHGSEKDDAEFVWVIDPIDGTKSFVIGRPIFGTLVACLQGGVPILGIIDQPVLGDRWIGARGLGTTLNGRPAAVRACGDLQQAIVSTTAPEAFPDAGERWRQLARRSRFASYGGDCYQYGQLAMGAIDLVVEAGHQLYDFAALVPVVTEAGGVMSDWQGRPLVRGSGATILAAGDERMHRIALEALADPRRP